MNIRNLLRVGPRKQRKVSQPGRNPRFGIIAKAPTFQQYVDDSDFRRFESGHAPFLIDYLRAEYTSTYGTDK